ncbi:MAG: hypothetical protein WAQ05_26770 [Rubrivivax sp.]
MLGSLSPVGQAEQHYSLDLGQEVVNEFKLELHCMFLDLGRTGDEHHLALRRESLLDVLHFKGQHGPACRPRGLARFERFVPAGLGPVGARAGVYRARNDVVTRCLRPTAGATR